MAAVRGLCREGSAEPVVGFERTAKSELRSGLADIPQQPVLWLTNGSKMRDTGEARRMESGTPSGFSPFHHQTFPHRKS